MAICCCLTKKLPQPPQSCCVVLDWGKNFGSVWVCPEEMVENTSVGGGEKFTVHSPKFSCKCHALRINIYSNE